MIAVLPTFEIEIGMGEGNKMDRWRYLSPVTEFRTDSHGLVVCYVLGRNTYRQPSALLDATPYL
jgi:hypothetical protein